MHRAILSVLLLSACAPWTLHTWGDQYLEAPLWAPRLAVPVADGLYIPLPHTGGLVRVTQTSDVTYVDLGASVLDSVDATPDGGALVGFLSRTECVDEDCEEEERFKQLAVIEDASVQLAVDVDPHFNAVAFSPTGNRGVAYLDVSRELNLDGVINLTAVAVLDMETAEVTPVQVGFAAERVLFTADDAGAVVLSQNRVAVLDLTTSPPTTSVVFPLTLDPDASVKPVGVELTPDGRYALISAEGSADLYVLDLQLHSVNIVSLASDPSAMWVDSLTDQTVFVYGRSAHVDIMEHDFFEVNSISLDEPMDRIVQGENVAALYSGSGYKDVYRLDVATHDVVEYRLQNPALDLVLSPSEDYAIALTRAEGGGGSGVSGLYDGAPGMEILDLRPGEDGTFPYLLEAPGVGLTFAASDTALFALLLQEGVDYVYQLDVYTGVSQEIELETPPLSLGTMPDGTVYITQDNAFGRVSFLDPVTGDMTHVDGFALDGLIDPTVLAEVE